MRSKASAPFTFWLNTPQNEIKMLQWWADYVDAIVNESKVIVGNFGGVA